MDVNATVGVIKDDISFTLETDTSNYAIIAILFHEGCSVAYMSQILNSHEQKYHTVKKKVCAIMEATCMVSILEISVFQPHY